MVSVAEWLEWGENLSWGAAGPEPAPQCAVLLLFPAGGVEGRLQRSPAAGDAPEILHKGAGDGEWPPPQPGGLLAAITEERKSCSAEKLVI